jgi:hypothetical protein
MQLAGLVASKAPSELDNTCTAAAPKDWKNEVLVIPIKNSISSSVAIRRLMHGLELVTFVAANSVGCGRHLHLALAIRRLRSRCIRRMLLIVALVQQSTEVNWSGVYLYHSRVLDAQIS